eukprot:TRINITY_DN3049_c0_g4_i2.p1 TRINITY_DN3049_c0_g4~~TRINITY_DN3049_c0_g4_i2.p1  ORF type:complete len:705 (+),score=112.10 TRINITY_DN3049_c0_g4_i2:42-2156(+)
MNQQNHIFKQTRTPLGKIEGNASQQDQNPSHIFKLGEKADERKENHEINHGLKRSKRNQVPEEIFKEAPLPITKFYGEFFLINHDADNPGNDADSFFQSVYRTNMLDSITSEKDVIMIINQFIDENLKVLSKVFFGIHSLRDEAGRRSGPIDLVALLFIFDLGIEIWESRREGKQVTFRIQIPDKEDEQFVMAFDREANKFNALRKGFNPQRKFKKGKTHLAESSLTTICKFTKQVLEEGSFLFPDWKGTFGFLKDVTFNCNHGPYITPRDPEEFDYHMVEYYLKKAENTERRRKRKQVEESGYSPECLNFMINLLAKSLRWTFTGGKILPGNGFTLVLDLSEATGLTNEQKLAKVNEFNLAFEEGLEEKKRGLRGKITRGDEVFYKLDKCNFCERLRLFHKMGKEYYAVPFMLEVPSLIQNSFHKIISTGKRPTMQNMVRKIEDVLLFTWPSMKEDIEQFLEAQQLPTVLNLPEAPPFLTKSPKQIFICDLMTIPNNITLATGFTHILNFIDHLSQFTFSKPIIFRNPNNLVQAASDILISELPKEVLTHCGSVFKDPSWKRLLRSLNIAQKTSVPHNPFADDSICELIKTIKTALFAQFQNYRLTKQGKNSNFYEQSQYFIQLHKEVLLNYNTQGKQGLTGMTPYELYYTKSVAPELLQNIHKKLAEIYVSAKNSIAGSQLRIEDLVNVRFQYETLLPGIPK